MINSLSILERLLSKSDCHVIDSLIFKIYYKITCIIFIIGSLVGVLSQYFEPIECDFGDALIDKKAAVSYCYLHGSTYIPLKYRSTDKCIAENFNNNQSTDHSYYQWVSFTMVVHFFISLIPYALWKYFENGKISRFNIKKSLSLNVKYFKTLLHKNNCYFFSYIICEFFNIVLIPFFQFYVINIFLNGQFLTYGHDAIQYYFKSKDQKLKELNPFCKVFPTEVSCEFPSISSTGGLFIRSGFCILNQNIYHEKLYFVLWIYLLCLMIFSIFFVLYRILTLCFNYIRLKRLFVLVSSDQKACHSLKNIMPILYIGDWFLIIQLSRNRDSHFIKEFVKLLENELINTHYV